MVSEQTLPINTRWREEGRTCYSSLTCLWLGGDVQLETSSLFLMTSLHNAGLIEVGLWSTHSQPFVTRQGLAAPIFLPCLCYSWTQPLTPIWWSHHDARHDLRPNHNILSTLNYLDYWAFMIFSALLCITLQNLMVNCAIYDDIGHASRLKLELLDWTGFYGCDLS